MFTVNPDASQVTFLPGCSGRHVHGTFHWQSGLIEFDPAAKTISGLVIVWAVSGDSGNKSRDRNMHDNVLQSEQFPLVTFAPKTYEGKLALSGNSAIQVSGIFTLLDTPHDITILMRIHIDGANLDAKGQFTIRYVQWGLKNPSVFIQGGKRGRHQP